MPADRTCDFHDDHDAQGEPCGNRCGQPATHMIRWRVLRFSYGCWAHAKLIRQTCPKLIRSIKPLGVLK